MPPTRPRWPRVAEIDLGKVDILVNSVGTNLVDRAFDQLTPASWARWSTPTSTPRSTCARWCRHAREGAGLIINIASIAARKPDRSGAAYQASKAGVLALTHAIMEEEWDNGMRLTAILPGMTDTPLLDRGRLRCALRFGVTRCSPKMSLRPACSSWAGAAGPCFGTRYPTQLPVGTERIRFS